MAETLGQANPFRYRGYYYDTETGFYYLNSRYYDPEIGRFINEDVYIYTGTGLMGYNMFAYCNNNPVMCKDTQGAIPAKDSGAYGTFDLVNYRAYRLVMQTETKIDKEKGEIIANFPIHNNPQASYLNDNQVAKEYSQKLHKKIDDIVNNSEQSLKVMTAKHIYSELLAHYYVYVGLDCFPFLQKNPKIANAYNSATTATLNPSESRIEVLLLMELISWTYE